MQAGGVTLLQAAAALVLWRSRRFDTLDIARLLGVSEADVCRVLHAVRDAELGAQLVVVS